jgi:hypothetical protein
MGSSERLSTNDGEERREPNARYNFSIFSISPAPRNSISRIRGDLLFSLRYCRRSPYNPVRGDLTHAWHRVSP